MAEALLGRSRFATFVPQDGVVTRRGRAKGKECCMKRTIKVVGVAVFALVLNAAPALAAVGGSITTSGG